MLSNLCNCFIGILPNFQATLVVFSLIETHGASVSATSTCQSCDALAAKVESFAAKLQQAIAGPIPARLLQF